MVSTSHGTPKTIKEVELSFLSFISYNDCVIDITRSLSNTNFLPFNGGVPKKQLLDGDCKYAVQTIATVLMTYKQ